jgi:hypothetical protein
MRSDESVRNPASVAEPSTAFATGMTWQTQTLRAFRRVAFQLL